MSLWILIFMESAEAQGWLQEQLATALHNCSHRPFSHSICLQPPPSWASPLHQVTPQSITHTDPGCSVTHPLACFSAGVWPAWWKLLESPEPPTSLDPLASSSFYCGISRVFILDALLFPLIFQNSLFNLRFYLDMMKFQACSQLHPRFQSVLVWRISLHPRKWYWSEPGRKSQRSQSHHCGGDIRISNSKSYWFLVLLIFSVLFMRVEFV